MRFARNPCLFTLFLISFFSHLQLNTSCHAHWCFYFLSNLLIACVVFCLFLFFFSTFFMWDILEGSAVQSQVIGRRERFIRTRIPRQRDDTEPRFGSPPQVHQDHVDKARGPDDGPDPDLCGCRHGHCWLPGIAVTPQTIEGAIQTSVHIRHKHR